MRKCANLTSLSLGILFNILTVGIPITPNYPGCKTILCIDDDAGMLSYQRALLERRGFSVLTAASARQGLQIAAACMLAAVIVDYHMPEMYGYEVAAEIKRLRPGTPIVMVSSDEELPDHALKMVDAFISKNEASRRLLPMIAKICGENPPGPTENRIAS
jgi:CheY-like chemotaxis protein